MKSGDEQLTVRRHSRVECDLGASLRVGAEHAAQVVFSRAVTEGDGAIPARVVDCSLGGLGLQTAVYLPRGTNLTVTFELDDPPTRHELLLRVQRSSMIAREPTYYLGTSLIERPGAAETVGAVLDAAQRRPREGAA